MIEEQAVVVDVVLRPQLEVEAVEEGETYLWYDASYEAHVLMSSSPSSVLLLPPLSSSSMGFDGQVVPDGESHVVLLYPA